MTSFKKPLLAVIALMTALVASLLLVAGPASAAPHAAPSATASNGENPTGPVTITISVPKPKCGQHVQVSGKNYPLHTTVVIRINGVKVGVAHTGSTGSFNISIVFICSGTGPQTITASGGGKVDSLTVHTGGSGSGGTGGGSSGGSGNGSGGLSSTGVAVVGIGAVGVVLLAGGGLLLFAGKRRRVSA